MQIQLQLILNNFINRKNRKTDGMQRNQNEQINILYIMYNILDRQT